MQLTDAQWARIAPLMPTPRGNCKLPSRQVLEGWLFLTKEGCSWRALPERFGPWHKVYMRGRRWIDKGVLERVFAELQRVELEAQLKHPGPDRPLRVSLDSTIVKVHQDGTGAPTKRGASDRPLAWRADDQAARRRPGRPPAADSDAGCWNSSVLYLVGRN